MIWEKINSWLGKRKVNIDSIVSKYLGNSDIMYNICNKFVDIFI